MGLPSWALYISGTRILRFQPHKSFERRDYDLDILDLWSTDPEIPIRVVTVI
jgi:hypothetical protein